MADKTHYRKAFNSPYLSSADIVGETNLTVEKVILEIDKTKKTKDLFNTAYFTEKQLREGEPLKPMILNATNSKMLKSLTGTPWIEEWKDVKVCVYVDSKVKMMGDYVEGLRIKQAKQMKEITPENAQKWEQAKAAYTRDGNFDAVTSRAILSEENQLKIIQEVAE
ncbi:unnamed protein product [marine sediment metagenome]|uniref:Uncharacterized protein n=1 Tax=marine sediment metagenome TaxID=412755 RepID=X0VLM7_9ZZZZ